MSEHHISWDDLHANIRALDPPSRRFEAQRDVKMLELSRDLMAKRTGIAKPSVREVQAYWKSLQDDED